MLGVVKFCAQEQREERNLGRVASETVPLSSGLLFRATSGHKYTGRNLLKLSTTFLLLEIIEAGCGSSS